MQTIKLNREWYLGPELAVGGFAQIHAAKSGAGDDVVVKLIPKVPGANRELLFEEITGMPNVLPILDTGEWGDFWALVMPRADKSLREHLTQSSERLAVDDAMKVLVDITTALAALQGKVVHRDLKPENVLLWQGSWCLADFGIARYAEATTATETWKHAKTWPYAAPEQWRGERATSATDVYATGVIAYELLSGERPFKGPEEHDFREQHLHVQPLPLKGFGAPLVTLVTECLFKAPGARPAPQNILARLQQLRPPSSTAVQRLQQVNQAAAERQSLENALASAAKSVTERRDSLAVTAEQSLNQIMGILRDRFRDVSQATYVVRNTNSWTFGLNEAEIGKLGFQRVAYSALDSPGYLAPFDVIAFSGIYIGIPADTYGYEGRSHSLWFCDAKDEGIFRWYETAFMCGVFSGRRGKKDPFSLDPGASAGRALTPVMGTEFQIAWPFTPIDQGCEEEFFERWMSWFADAAERKLSHPRTMPERDPIGSWRKRS